MSGVTGRSMKMAFAKFGTNSWGSAASVTKGIYFESDGGMQLKPDIITDNAFNQNFLAPGDPGLIEAPVLTLKGRDRYDDFQYIWEALAMGSPAAVVISTSAAGQTTSWSHQFDLADAIDGLGLTLAIDKQLYIDELSSAKVHGFSVEDADNGAMDMSYRVTGSRPTNISSININSTLAGASYPALQNRVTQPQGTFRMNLFSAGALGASDVIKAEKIKFGFNRPQDAPNVFGQDFVDEPADNGWPEFTVEVNYSRMNTPSANSLYTGLRSGVSFKADWTFLGPFINSTDQYKKLYQFPCLQLMDDGWKAETQGAQQVKPVAKFAARLAPTSPTGIPFIRPFRLTRIMTQSVVAF